MRLVRFTLVVDTESSSIDINPEHVETVIGATPFQKGLKCSQLRMISGTSCFVKEDVDQVRKTLLGAQ